MKTLIVYYSRTKTTKKVAEALAQKLEADLEEIIDKKDRAGAFGYLSAGRDATRRYLTDIEPAKKAAGDYDLVIIGTPIWSWNLSTPVRTYLSENKEILYKIKTAFFSTMSGSGHERAGREMGGIIGREPVATLGLLTKEVVRDEYGSKLEEFINKIIQAIK
ncbi:MAG: flavodoxin domain-containing protein [Candidatus Falkowbacteria bacterium]